MQPGIRQLELFVTKRCTLRCTYCFCGARGTQDRPPDATPELIDRAVDFLLSSCGDHPRLQLTFWGGEPLLRIDLLERAAVRARAHAARMGRELTLAAPTNLTLLDAAMIDRLEACDIQLTLSLDGVGPAAHAARRAPAGKPGWPLVERGLSCLLDHRRPGRSLPPVRMTITPARAGALAEELAALCRLGFRRVSFLPASGLRWDEQATARLDEQLAAVAEDLASRIRRGEPDLPCYPPLLQWLVPLYLAGPSGLPRVRRTGRCGAGETLLAVDTLGDLYPCHRAASRLRPPAALRLGDLTSGITEQALHRRLAALEADAPGVRCARCSRRESCAAALCPALDHELTGALEQVPDAACWVNERLGRAASRLHDALAREPDRYRAYLEPLIAEDPDLRLLPLLAVLQHEPESLLERADRLLRSLDPHPHPHPHPHSGATGGR